MFELSVALKYLVPKWRQLSVSIISLISIVVIALVVWLIVVFFSVTYGLEKSWVQKLIALTAPVRVSPTSEYYHSYYYLADSVSGNSDYTAKSIDEKLLAEKSDPYDPEFDEEVPMHWLPPDVGSDGEVKDIVKLAYQSVQKIPEVHVSDYEMTIATLNLNLVRNHTAPGQIRLNGKEEDMELSNPMYLSTFDADNPSLAKSLLPVTSDDVRNLMELGKGKLVQVKSYKTPAHGWRLPSSAFPKECELEVCVVKRDGKTVGLVIPKEAKQVFDIHEKIPDSLIATLTMEDGQRKLTENDGQQLPLGKYTPLFLESDLTIAADQPLTIQGIEVSIPLSHRDLEIDQFTFDTDPLHTMPDEGVLLPKSYREAGVLIGDQGHISYHIPTASSMQEQRLPVHVVGFYDPGILPLGGKVVLANHDVVSMIRSSYPTDETALTNGINIRFNDLDRAEAIKGEIVAAFKKEGIERYWKVETYREFDFTKDILQQLRSEKNLFTILSAVIIIVACSNIISMLIILVNDKRTEIGILRSMGATSRSIATIFGFCGMVMGVIGSAIGILAAMITLYNLQALIDFISRVQGFEMFNPLFYGDTLPNELSFKTLTFVLISTGLISLLAGIVPAVKACMMRPSEILRSE